ncbi:MAG: hypothetical protein PHQ58_06390 [Rhodoferax sp.]|uniref:hypothetical protein n=1 Tax=Rhodoferax sp. TaxID=50421 RepID=UPI00261CAC4D|nr:hypothetical protein [Rhodoferax sp.]MDD2880046.1 hypothetical protein [Rhodoferax sp.]
MKSSKFTLATLALMLAFGTAAYAKGPMNGQAGGTGAGAQSRAGDPGVGTQTRTQAHAQTHVQAEDSIRTRLQTMSADGVAGTGVATGTGTPRGIHTPGTGLTTSTDGTAAVAQ